jgi:hypothetical protein
MAAHEVSWRAKNGSAYTTDEGVEVEEHTLFSWVCSCGERGGVWYATEPRVAASFERHVARATAKEAQVQANG